MDCANIGFEVEITLGWAFSNGVVVDANLKIAYQNETPYTIGVSHLIASLSDFIVTPDNTLFQYQFAVIL